MTSSTRNALIILVLSPLAGYLFYRADSFWGIVTCGFIFVWAAVAALPIMDGPWRLRAGFTLGVFLTGLLALWPTFDEMTTGLDEARSDGTFVGNVITPLEHVAAKVGHCPAWLKEKGRVDFAIAPGLDLRGGLRLVYTVEVEEAIKDKRNNIADEMRQELATSFGIHSGDKRPTLDELNKLREKVIVSAPETEPAIIRVKFTNAAEVAKIDDRFSNRFQEVSQSKGPGNDTVTFKIRSEVESNIRERAVTQAKDTVNRRVDELGLREANVTTRDEDIIVEVPGQNKEAFESIKDVIRRTARLEFKLVDSSVDFFNKVKDDDLPAGEGITIFRDVVPNGLNAEGKKQSTEIHFARIALADKDYTDAAGNLIDAAHRTDADDKRAMDNCKKRFKAWTDQLSVPDDHQIGFEAVQPFDPETGKSTNEGWRTVYLYKRADLTGDYITDVGIEPPREAGRPYAVGLTFSPAGADRFEELTGANVQRQFAIILDDVVDSTPVILGKIGGGRGQITMGSGDPEKQLHDAQQLELVLKSGALPAPIAPSNESFIGPSLGKDAIDKGVKGMAMGSLLVLAFMWFYYRKSGFVADVAVLFNLLLQMSILASFSATMTLPGIAGLALTLGMSVDCNVLINERIREELRQGRSVRAAVEAGYNKAFSSILDGHVTVFITALILAQYGAGPVKGFAVTLLVGIICSLYTGVFCTRIVFDWWARGAKVKRLSVGAEF
jgi:preprotein translocase subunit SecD